MFEFTSLYFDTPPQKQRIIDFWIPRQAPDSPPLRPVALFFVHGGGWRGGHRQDMHRLMHTFVEQGYPCAALCYHLEGATIADQLADIRVGLAHFSVRLQKHGLSQRVVLYGSSAGGHLALLTGLAHPGACGEEILPETSAALAALELAGIVASCAPTTFEPWPDIFPAIWGNMERAAGIPHAQDPELYKRLSPRHHFSPKAPPMLFIMGEFEHIFPNAHTLEWAQELRTLGHRAETHIYPMAEHGFFYDTTRRAQQMAYADLLRFLESLPPCPPAA